MTTEIPILFSTAMVQAILEGRKSQTRRILKHPKNIPADHILRPDFMKEKSIVWFQNPEYSNVGYSYDCPYGKPGDVLYVREEHYRYGAWQEKEGHYTKGGRQKWMFVPHTDELLFEPPTTEYRKGRHHKDPYTPAWHERLARFMPKSAARIWLQVESVRVERLQDITDSDAIAEGIESYVRISDIIAYKNYSEFARKDFLNVSKYGFDNGKETQSAPVASFCTLWISINDRESWISNPWVWVISFRVLSTTGKPDYKSIKA